jgi:hypothetical protein
MGSGALDIQETQADHCVNEALRALDSLPAQFFEID